MNIPAMKYYDTNVYKNYKNNIEILEDTVEIQHGFVGDYVSLLIIDNNKKYFRKRRLSGEFLGTDNTNELDRHIEELITDYITHTIGVEIHQEINNKLVKDWRCENVK